MSKRDRAIFVAFLLISSASVLGGTPTTPHYTYIDLNTLGFGGDNSNATAINNLGQVTGYLSTASIPTTYQDWDFINQKWVTTQGSYQEQNAFLYGNGQMVDIGRANEASNGAAINNNGIVVGTIGSADNLKRAYRLTYGPLDETAGPGFLNPNISASYATGINDSNTIVGNAYLANGYGGFIYRNNTWTDIGPLLGKPSAVRAINNNGQVVGDSYTSANPTSVIHAFQYDEATGTTTDIGKNNPFGGNSYAFAINDKGTAVGIAEGGGGQRAVEFANGQVVPIPLLPNSTESDAAGINYNGDVVGRSGFHGFADLGGTLYDLNNLATVPSGWTIESGNAINDSGEIVGYAYTGFGSPEHAFLMIPDAATVSLEGFDALPLKANQDIAGTFSASYLNTPLSMPVPEPGTAIIVTVAGLGLLRRRRSSTIV